MASFRPRALRANLPALALALFGGLGELLVLQVWRLRERFCRPAS